MASCTMDDDEEKQSQPIKKGQLSGSPETPVSDDGKPLIKLKMPKVEGGVREEEISGKVQSRVCEVCDKTFSSGKALGGHMRVHVQNKEVSPKKLKTSHQPIKKQRRKQIINASDSNDSTNVHGGDGNSKPTCSLCAKNFPSMKSLFGHMRCHPEREWRGIQPPAAKNSPLSSVSDAVPGKTDDRIDSDAATTEIPVVDLTRSLTRWSVTGMRGRKACTACSAVSSEEEERLHDAVQYLMKLAHGNSLESGLTHKHIHEEYEATNSNSMNSNQVSESKKLRIEESPVGYRSDYPVQKLKIDERGSTDDAGNSGVNSEYIEKSKGKAVLETGYIPENSVTLSLNCQWVNTDWHREDDYKNFPDDDELESRPMVMIKNKKKRKKLKLRDLESVHDGNPVDHQSQKPVGYKCSTCNRCFPTHQALGGHRSSHNKVRNFQNTIDESSSAAAGDEQHAYPIINETKESEGAASSKMVEMSTHQCKICKKTFPTGQALGGHKRCHWIAPAVEAPSSQVTSPGEPGESSQTCRKVLDFDLNEPAAMEEYEQGFEHENGGGCPSSSYNSVA